MRESYSLGLSAVVFFCLGAVIATAHHPVFSVPFFMISAGVALLAITRQRGGKRSN
ncbi:hypothetical protein [Allobranchiibius huperziae]|uniref:Uncharacterized protein n=1 Tax=Allobranchiibius huperziae TaxID=1874116 RepID=A0A853DHW4_9MICO|nr:hypothetical protein [Allobranchiibius huperziae]NYJ75613.1 hypothetical protein [Allobranchiibius huperziae]